MTKGPLLSKIIMFSLPVIASNLLQLLFNASDMIVVGNFAEPGSLGAVGATTSLINLVVNLFIGLSIGSCVVIARYIGQKDKKSITRAAHTSIVIALILGVVVGIIGLLVSRPVLTLMGTHKDIIDRSVTYMQIYFLGTPANMLYNFGSSIMRAGGDTKRPLVYMAISGVINIALNLFLVIEFQMGVAGVAIATIASQYISAALVIIHLMRSDGDCKISLSRLGIDRHELSMIAKVGLPAGIQSSFFSISNMVIQSAINSFGIVAIVDGNAASSNLEGFVYTAMNSISQATLAFVSQNYGAANSKRIDKSIRITAAITFVIGVIMGGLFCLFSKQLISLYNNDPATVEAGAERMYWVCSMYFLCGLMDLLSSAQRGLGRSTTSMLVSLMGAAVFRIVWIYTVFGMYHTEICLYLSYPISWLLTDIVHFICLMHTRKTEYKKLDAIASCTLGQ